MSANSKNRGVDFHIYRDGEEIRLNIIDENSSVLITFATEKEFHDFIRTVEKAKKEILRDG